MKNSLMILLGMLSISCNPRPVDSLEEDYSKIFPHKDIEKPEISYEDMVQRFCDPEQPLRLYKYPGVEIANEREYTVTLSCIFNEGSGGYKSRYEIRYIDEDKNIKTISTDEYANANQILEDGKRLEKTFKVKSGYPMYLLVNGVGDRNSNISASIKAQSNDGLIIVPELETTQYQNSEGPNKIEEPYCHYIILP